MMRIKYRHSLWLALFLALVSLTSCIKEEPLPEAPFGQITIGRANNEIAGQILELNGGGYLVVGGSQDIDDRNYDLLVTKLDVNGAEVFSHHIGEKNFDEVGWKVTRAGASEFMVLGTKRALDGGESVIQMTKLDADLNVMWQKSSSVSVPNTGLTLRGASIFSLPDGNFFVGFTTESYPVTMRFDASGQLINEDAHSQWYGEPKGSMFCKASDGSIAGIFGRSPYSSATSQMVAIRFDSLGSFVGEQLLNFNSGFQYRLDAATADPNGGYWISLYDQSYGSHQIIFIDENWVLGSSTSRAGVANFNRVLVLHNGRLFFSGYDSFPYESYGQDNVQIVYWNPTTGNDIRSAAYGGTQVEHCWDIHETSDNRVAVLGETQSYGAGGSDIFLVFVGLN